MPVSQVIESPIKAFAKVNYQISLTDQTLGKSFNVSLVTQAQPGGGGFLIVTFSVPRPTADYAVILSPSGPIASQTVNGFTLEVNQVLRSFVVLG